MALAPATASALNPDPADSAKDASQAFNYHHLPSGGAVHWAPGASHSCAQRVTATSYACVVEYRNGRRWHYISGAATWDHAAGRWTITIDYRRQWARRWRTNTRACLASWHLHGKLSSNFGCAAAIVAHQYRGVGYSTGTGTGFWPWLFRYPCRARGGVTTCANTAGDAYSYTTLPVYGP